ncbi:MAG: NFACT family protein [Candidatus Diapherotrites archaeon]
MQKNNAGLQEKAIQGFEMPNLTLSALLREMVPVVEGSFVEKAQDLEKGWVKLRLRTTTGAKDLVFSLNAFFLAEYRVDARQQSSGFGAFLKSRIAGKKIVSLKQIESERIAFFEFSEFSLVAELFGKGNLLLLDRDGIILKPLRKEEWRSRTLASGKKYSMPPSRGVNPAGLSLEELKKTMKESSTDIVRAMLSSINVPPVVAEEACARAGLAKETLAKNLSENDLKKLHSVLHSFYSLEFSGGKACIAEHGGKRVLLPFEPKSGIPVLCCFESLNSALSEIVLKDFLMPAKKDERRKLELERAIADQRKALAACEISAEENRKKAELIYAHYPDLMRAVLELRALSEQKGSPEKEKTVMYKKDFGGVYLLRADLKNKKAVFELPSA